MRPGIWRLYASLAARKAACGPPNPIGTPNRWLDPTAMSAPKFTGRAQQCEGQEVRGHDDQHSCVVSLLDERLIVADITIGGRILQQHSAQLRIIKIDRLSSVPHGG